jgi:CHAT domain
MLEVTVSPVHLGDADLKICLTNSGPDEYLNVIFVIRLPAGLMRLRGQEKIGPVRLPPGKTVCEKLRVRAEKPGRYRLTSPNFSYQDHNGRPHREPSFAAEIIVFPAVEPSPGPTSEPGIHTERQTHNASANPMPAPKPPQSPGQLVKVLYLAANPVDPADPGRRRLRVDEEFREIQQTVSQGRERDNIRLESRWAVQPRDIMQALFTVEPHFVHFAGHGDTKEGSIVVGDEYGYTHTIPVEGLVRVFQTAGQGVRCVVVNACSTERLARALAADGLCVVGMRQPVGDHSAVRFSIGFYQALAAGRSVKTAFDAGVALLMMSPLRDDDRAPLLLCGGQQGC